VWIVIVVSFVWRVWSPMLYNAGDKVLPELQVKSCNLTAFKSVPFRLEGLSQEGSGDQGYTFSCKVLDLMNLRKGTNWQSHRSGFPSIVLQYKTFTGKIISKIVVDHKYHKSFTITVLWLCRWNIFLFIKITVHHVEETFWLSRSNNPLSLTTIMIPAFWLYKG
jgi:hypothetical protein